MAEHEEPYRREPFDEKSALTPECGHHCGIIVQSGVRQEGHCSCRECHARPVPPRRVEFVR